MKTISLPGDIFPGKENKPVIIHDYVATEGVFRGRSILQKNAISMVIRGEKTMLFAEKSVHVFDDEFHFLSAGCCMASVNLSGKESFRSILIFFDDSVLEDFYLKYNSRITDIKSKHTIGKEPYIGFKKDSFVINFISSLNLLLQPQNEISDAMMLLKLEELLLHLLETHPAKLLGFQPGKKEYNDFEIRKAVETNIVNGITLEELAFLCNISLSTFKRRFTKIYNTSPSKWLLQKRMELAKDLLEHHHEKPSEVFHKVGYENHSSFTQSFKQTFGVTPKEFQLSIEPVTTVFEPAALKP